MNSLQLAEIKEVETIEREAFKIEDKQQAEWALRKIKAYKAQIDENNTLAEAEIQRVTDWKNSENKAAEDSIGYFTALLQEFMLKEKANDPKLKSIKLPHGTLALKKQQPDYQRDNDKLLESLESLGWSSYIKKEEIKEAKWADLKKEIDKSIKVVDGKLFTLDGELIEGVEVKERDDKFGVKVN